MTPERETQLRRERIALIGREHFGSDPLTPREAHRLHRLQQWMEAKDSRLYAPALAALEKRARESEALAGEVRDCLRRVSTPTTMRGGLS
jgi:hypothetical protein